MKKEILVVVALISSLVVFAQKDDKTIATINGEKITVGEFKKVYEKNLNAIDNDEGKDVAKNLDLYINYKLKVQQAYAANLDTLRSYKREIQSYKNQLTAPYLQDKEFFNELVKDAYYRTKNEIRASHILIRLPKNFTPADTLKAYNKIIDARNRVVKGEDFAKVAKETSEDPSAQENGGDLGYFYAFRMVYDFEEAAYTVKDGEVSQPFRTRFGYHIVKRTGTRPSAGERQVAHILVTDTTAVGKTKIDEVYKKLQDGEDFKALAKQYSGDRNTKDRGGVLPKFGSGRMVKSFEEAAFSVTKEGEYSAPVKTRFGWHIIKLIRDFPVGSFDEMKSEIEERVKRTGRGKLSDNAVLERLKSEYKVVEDASGKEILKRKDLRTIPLDSAQAKILTINEKEIPQKDFIRYTINRRHLPIDALFENFVNQEILTYFKDNLKNTNPEFAATLKEYEDGLLLFELMQRKVWNKSNDSISLKGYFDTNASRYDSKDLSKIKGKVMNDYQNYLEDQWVKELRSGNSIKINKGILKKLVKFYRKES
jgi:peptidyl-prolyl cis-trans isomerase SurA